MTLLFVLWSKRSASEEASKLQGRIATVEAAVEKLEATVRSIRTEWVAFYEKAHSLLARLNARKRWAERDDGTESAEESTVVDQASIDAQIREGRFPLQRRVR